MFGKQLSINLCGWGLSMASEADWRGNFKLLKRQFKQQELWLSTIYAASLYRMGFSWLIQSEAVYAFGVAGCLPRCFCRLETFLLQNCKLVQKVEYASNMLVRKQHECASKVASLQRRPGLALFMKESAASCQSLITVSCVGLDWSSLIES